MPGAGTPGPYLGSKYMQRLFVTICHPVRLVVVLSVLIASCGQKGPLYLPDEPNTEQDERQEESTVTD